MIESFTWTTELMAGGQEKEHTITWNPQAHSVLNTTTNELTGGLICASVNYTDDDDNNDILEKQVPIAFTKKEMDTEPVRLYTFTLQSIQ